METAEPAEPAEPPEPPTLRRLPFPWPPWTFGSGAAVGTLFARGFALISIVAWLSLGSQVHVLVGSRGLLPAADLIDMARAQPGVSWRDLPTMLWWFHSDAALSAGVAAGIAFSLCALLGLARRICFALSTILYLSYVTVARDFLFFQWDSLLIECGLLAALLPTNRPAPVAHLVFRLLLFKLYFESGIAKWSSHLHDWHDGSAMTYYYETAPLPTWLAWRAHHLPVWWHHFESRATLVLELVVPFGIFGPRPVRRFAAVAFTLFQIGNAATANYGFFCFLSVVLGVFLLDDADVERARARVARFGDKAGRKLRGLVARLFRPRPAQQPSPPGMVGKSAAWAGATAFAFVSLIHGCNTFGSPTPAFDGLLALDARLHLVNSYHLFASITRERIEPEFQTLAAGTADAAPDTAWTPHHMWHKPGDVNRAPNFVAPHQPRVDFRLWFYGLGFQRRAPAYVTALLERLCGEPEAVQQLFRAPLPAHPAAVRIVFWQYWFTSPDEERATGAWWRRARVATSRAVPCAAVP
jgi:lipase maturation factor 1